jgi:hypothetical protein
MVCLIHAVTYLQLAPHKIMSALNNIQLQQAINLRTRLSLEKSQDNSVVVCEVVGYDIATASFKGKAPDGSLRYFRFIGNAALPIGSQVSVVLPDKGLIGWVDTKAR